MITVNPIPDEDVIKTTTKTTTTPYVDPPLFTITNPVNYLRRWWKRVIAREGIDFRLRVHPVTAFAIIIMVGGAAFGAGRISLPPVVSSLIPQWAIKPSPTPDPWKDTVMIGVLARNSAGKYYLVIPSSSVAITLQLPVGLDLSASVGKRILVSGKFNSETNLLIISDASQMEVLLKVAPVKTKPSPSPTASVSATPVLSPSPESAL